MPNEDEFVVPPALRRKRYVRRGEPGLRPRRVDAEAALAVLADVRRRETPAQLRDENGAALAYHDGKPDPTPYAAAAAVLAWRSQHWRDQVNLAAVADLWLARYGLRFAAEAVVELSSMAYTFVPRATKGFWELERIDATDRHRYPLADEVLLGLAGIVRHALATAADDEYRDVVALLATHRGTNPLRRAATSFLAPAEAAWVEADTSECGSESVAAVLLGAAGTAEQADRLASVTNWWWMDGRPGVVASLVEAIGVDAFPALLSWATTHRYDPAPFVAVIAAMPADAAFDALIDLDRIAELRDAADRFPARAIRLLAARPPEHRATAELLRVRVLGCQELAASIVPTLPPAAADRVRALLDAADAGAAPTSTLPPVLVSPPWATPRPARTPTVITSLTCDDPVAIAWEPGELEAWREISFSRGHRDDWTEIIARLRDGEPVSDWDAGGFFSIAPEDQARPWLGHWKPDWHDAPQDMMRHIAARFGVDAYPAVWFAARKMPKSADTLLPFTSPQLATTMAEAYARGGTKRPSALRWLTRHPYAAARALIPAALGKAATARGRAERALRAIVSAGHADVVRAAAASHGAEAAAAIEVLLGTDPLDRVPATMPPIPAWADAAVLPPLRTPDGVLPLDAVRQVLAMLSISTLDEPYPGLTFVVDLVDRRDLGAFGWALFTRWQAEGNPAKQAWAFEALAHLGDDDVVRGLSPLIRAWPSEGNQARAAVGVEILALIGTDTALLHLATIAEKAKVGSLRDRAADRIAALGLRPDQLVPDLGLAADGSMRLDYGARAFTVGFDERLQPYVTDDSGKRLTVLPKPGVRDDPEPYRRFSGLRKDVRTIAATQLGRLETAMVTGRRWTGAEFARHLAGHPLLVHLVRRLVWTADGMAFRVAEDRTCADVTDRPVTVADDATVGVVHPIALGDTLTAWAALFADYEILQPFPQLGRETYPDPDLRRFEGRTVPAALLLGLERHGWRRGDPDDHGVQDVMTREGATITLTPGLWAGGGSPDQRINHVDLDSTDAIVLSEITRALTLALRDD
ncbi:DUF4132 domain-containing protein [Catenuloplanes japonicus]|uniref:DUF4132 domain-containing protein n=1 Tax=Catenuloplanes japonicus TaxID=33876 RepID=UPI000691EA7F|nr:DUF4132 domain-containing protein [Catenuloplanes japonicus]